MQFFEQFFFFTKIVSRIASLLWKLCDNIHSYLTFFPGCGFRLGAPLRPCCHGEMSDLELSRMWHYWVCRRGWRQRLSVDTRSATADSAIIRQCPSSSCQYWSASIHKCSPPFTNLQDCPCLKRAALPEAVCCTKTFVLEPQKKSTWCCTEAWLLNNFVTLNETSNHIRDGCLWKE